MEYNHSLQNICDLIRQYLDYVQLSKATSIKDPSPSKVTSNFYDCRFSWSLVLFQT